MNRPLVTVGISFKNPGTLIVAAIRSVFSQTLKDWELILIDDGSTDGTPDVVARITDPRVRFISDKKNLGLAARLNQITSLARGCFIARMDADDIMHPNRLEEQVKFLAAHPWVDVVDTAAIIIDSTGMPIGIRGHTERKLTNVTEVLKWGRVLHPSMMARRQWYIDHPYDTRYDRAEDRELFVRTYKETLVEHFTEPLHFYRIGSVRVTAFLTGYRSERRVLLEYGPRLVGWPLSFVLLVRSCCKSAILKGLSLVKLENVALWGKYEHLDSGVREETMHVLSTINETHVPGWDSLLPT